MSHCPNGWFGQHRFEPRYDIQLPAGLKFGGFEGTPYAFDKLKDKTYVRDVCARCGATIERTKP